jgi:hypothetical protein
VSIKTDVREIDPFSLPALPLEDHLNLPDVCAIYFALSKQQEILSIGRAQRLGRRWHTHHRLTQLEYIGRVKIAWLVIEPHVLIDPIWLEEECIQHFCPLLNGTEIPLNMGNSYSLEEQSRGPVTL